MKDIDTSIGGRLCHWAEMFRLVVEPRPRVPGELLLDSMERSVHDGMSESTALEPTDFHAENEERRGGGVVN